MSYESDITKFIRKYLQERSAPPPPRHAPKTGGAEYTFRPLSEREE
jgi:hypothetical protein